jgi:type IV pilus assembly protein PilF
MKPFAYGLLLVLAVGGCASGPTQEEQRSLQSAQANAELGLRYMQQGNNNVAMEKLKKALSFDPESVTANHYIAELYRRLERYDDAERHFRIALGNASNNSDLNNNFGVFLCSREQYDESERYFLKALEDPVYGARAQAYENLGICQQREGDIVKAESYFRKGLAINPRMDKSLFALMEISFARKDYMAARAFLQRYLEMTRHTPQTLWIGIQTERVLGNKDAVSSYALLLKNNFPNSPEARLYQETEQRP